METLHHCTASKPKRTRRLTETHMQVCGAAGVQSNRVQGTEGPGGSSGAPVAQGRRLLELQGRYNKDPDPGPGPGAEGSSSESSLRRSCVEAAADGTSRPSSPTFLRSLKKEEFLLSDRENVSGPPGTGRSRLVVFRGFTEGILGNINFTSDTFSPFSEIQRPKVTRSFVRFSLDRRSNVWPQIRELDGFQLLTSERVRNIQTFLRSAMMDHQSQQLEDESCGENG